MTLEAMQYIKALLNSSDGSPEQEIGWAMWMTAAREAQLEYLTEVMTVNREGSRGFEIAADIWLLLGERGVAA